jgi:hypothetical protein
VLICPEDGEDGEDDGEETNHGQVNDGARLAVCKACMPCQKGCIVSPVLEYGYPFPRLLDSEGVEGPDWDREQ